MSSTFKEEWRDIQGFEGLYQVSNKGRVKSFVGFNGHEYVKREKILKPTKQRSKGNYFRLGVSLVKDKKRYRVKIHRLVAFAFLKPVDGKVLVNHLDGNPLNNNYSNIEWCTQSENMRHAYDTGLKNMLRIPMETLYDLYVVKKLSPKEIGEMYKASADSVRRLIKSHGVKIKVRPKFGITECELMNELEAKSQTELAKEIGCSQSLISHYKKRILERGYIYAK